MPETPYCPLLSINKDVPVLCQEELCMWYVKQLKLCSITVLAYTQAMSLQNLPTGTPQSVQAASKPQTQQQPSTQTQTQVKQNITKDTQKQQTKTQNPFILDDLD